MRGGFNQFGEVRDWRESARKTAWHETKCFDSDFYHSEEVAWKSKVDWERATSERPSPDLARPYLLKLHHVLQRNAPRIVCFLSQVDNIILRERLFQTRVLHISFCCATASEVAHISASHGHAIVEFYDIRSAQVDGTGWWIGTGRTLQLGEMQSCHPVGWSNVLCR